MSQVGNTEQQFSGEYMVQDSDHMSGIPPVTAGRRTTKQQGGQVEQSQASDRQQGDGDHGASRQHGGERSGKGRRAHQ